MNDLLLKGKIDMPDILKILTMFRFGKYAMIGDIEKMFWQIHIDDEDQKFHGILYNDTTYVFTRVSFGGKPSPTIADSCMVKIAHEGKDTHRGAASILSRKRYMDDLTNASDDETILIKDKNECNQLLGKFGFRIKSWVSNSERIGEKPESQKLLGIIWNIHDDTLSVKVPNHDIDVLTKRTMLAKVAKIWDPLGILVGITIRA